MSDLMVVVLPWVFLHWATYNTWGWGGVWVFWGIDAFMYFIALKEDREIKVKREQPKIKTTNLM